MRVEVLAGPTEYGIRLIREDEDGLAWDVVAAKLQRFANECHNARVDEALRMLRESWRRPL